MYQMAAFADGTRNNLISQWKAYFLFCTYFELPVLPASVDSICMYVQFLSRSFSSVNSIKNYLNAVKLLHLFNDLECRLDVMDIKLLLKGITRLHPHCEKRALPIDPYILMEFYEF